jgi:hypothetical protein
MERYPCAELAVFAVPILYMLKMGAIQLANICNSQRWMNKYMHLNYRIVMVTHRNIISALVHSVPVCNNPNPQYTTPKHQQTFNVTINLLIISLHI